MSSELSMVTQLAIILIAAGIFTVISKALKQPLILGYIVAGFIVGPHLGLFPQFSPESVHEWSELGIVFLLFGLGLEFSFKKLLNVGSAAIISAGTIAAGMLLVGFATGTILKWTFMESLFLGGMMSMSSTTIIIKAYDDLGKKNAPYANLVFGLLVVEDLLAVLMMVLFSTIAVSNKFNGTEMLLSLGKLVAFLVLCFLVGIFVLPTLFKKAEKYLSEEILLLISVGLCFLMVILANKAGFSSALGAFLMGSILSSTIQGEKIEHITTNIKNLFGAIFFVSVGMMVDPAVIAQYWPIILVLTVAAMIGILIFSTSGVLLAGKGLDTAVHVGFSLPQLGEFSFIIAGLGCSLGVIRDFIYPSIIAVSVITTFTTPYMIKAADPVSAWLHRVLPASLVTKLDRSIKTQQGNSTKAEKSLWNEFLKRYFLRLGLYSLILIVLLIGLNEYLPTLADIFIPDLGRIWRQVILTGISVVLAAPFIYGLAVNSGKLKTLADDLIENSPRARIPVLVSIFFRILVAAEFGITAITLFTKITGWKYVLVFATLAAIFYSARKTKKRFTNIEDRFFTNLKAKETHDKGLAPVTAMVSDKFAGYDVHIKTVKVPSDFALAGLTLREMPFRDECGVNIVKIQRGSRAILIPSSSEVVFPGDSLVAVGTTAQLADFTAKMKKESRPEQTEGAISENFNMEPIEILPGSMLDGKLLKETAMRNAGCTVISVVRDNDYITNPDKEFKFNAGDIVWIAGVQSSIDFYKGAR